MSSNNVSGIAVVVSSNAITLLYGFITLGNINYDAYAGAAVIMYIIAGAIELVLFKEDTKRLEEWIINQYGTTESAIEDIGRWGRALSIMMSNKYNEDKIAKGLTRSCRIMFALVLLSIIMCPMVLILSAILFFRN